MGSITTNAIPRQEHRTPLDVARVRRDFPILKQPIRGKPLVYLDNAASTQKPTAVIDTVRDYYECDNSNVHRGVHLLSERATQKYEQARDTVRKFINAADRREIIFCRGTTEAINLVASSYGLSNIGKDDEVLITHMEHHSNIVPWQILCQQTGAKLRVASVDDNGDLDLDQFENLIGPRTRVISVVHVSNTLGTVNPVRDIIKMARDRDIPILLDGAQSAPHMPVDVRDLDCDFYAFSGHKVYGPTGIGVLYGRAALLDKMPPYQGGGDMIASVSFEKTTYNVLPYKFEAGTPNIAGTIGLGAAIEYMTELGLENIAAHENDLIAYATERLSSVDGLRLIGQAKKRAGAISFVLDGIHPHDIGTILDQDGIALRTGHHCTQPLMERFNVPATARASFGIYNTRDDIDALVTSIDRVKEMFN